MPLAYGGSRTDAAPSCGGHAKVGFGAIFNYARLGAGTHTAVLSHNGVEFARSTFTVGTVSSGRDFLDDVTARQEVQDFPEEDVTTVLEWNEATQHFEIVSEPAPQDLESPEAACRPAEGVCLENPSLGGNYSGIGIISGWKCSAVDLTASINGGPPFPVLYGNIREDTQKVCGDTDNGFVVPSWNWSRVRAGEHTIVVYDQGIEFARSTFTVGTAGVEFVAGVNRQITVFGFPYPLEDTDFEWNEATQHFEMLGGPGGPGNGPGELSFGEATIAAQSYTQNTAIPSLTLPQATGGTAPLVYSLSPALPAGLSFNQTTRTLSGTPASTLNATTYTYTATDGSEETATLTFTITVSAQSPSLSFGNATIANQSYTQNTAITSLTLPQATGGTPPLTYSLSPALPTGLSFNPTSRVLSGTPTATLSTTTYTYTVTDGSGSGPTASLTFTIAVNAAIQPDDHGNSQSTATLVGRFGGSSGLLTFKRESGNLETGGDSDYFRIEVSQAGIIVAETEESTDTRGVLVIPGEDIYDDDSGASTNFRVGWPVSAGTVYVRVQGFSQNTTGSYTLKVRWYDDSSFSVSVRDRWLNGSYIDYRLFVLDPSGQRIVVYPRDAVDKGKDWSTGPNTIDYHYVSVGHCIKGGQVCVGAEDQRSYNGTWYEYGLALDGEDNCSDCCYSCSTGNGSRTIGGNPYYNFLGSFDLGTGSNANVQARDKYE